MTAVRRQALGAVLKARAGAETLATVCADAPLRVSLDCANLKLRDCFINGKAPKGSPRRTPARRGCCSSTSWSRWSARRQKWQSFTQTLPAASQRTVSPVQVCGRVHKRHNSTDHSRPRRGRRWPEPCATRPRAPLQAMGRQIIHRHRRKASPWLQHMRPGASHATAEPRQTLPAWLTFAAGQ